MISQQRGCNVIELSLESKPKHIRLPLPLRKTIFYIFFSQHTSVSLFFKWEFIHKFNKWNMNVKNTEEMHISVCQHHFYIAENGIYIVVIEYKLLCPFLMHYVELSFRTFYLLLFICTTYWLYSVTRIRCNLNKNSHISNW